MNGQQRFEQNIATFLSWLVSNVALGALLQEQFERMA